MGFHMCPGNCRQDDTVLQPSLFQRLDHSTPLVNGPAEDCRILQPGMHVRPPTDDSAIHADYSR